MQYSQMLLFWYVLGRRDCLQAVSQRENSEFTSVSEWENKTYLNASYLHVWGQGNWWGGGGDTEEFCALFRDAVWGISWVSSPCAWRDFALLIPSEYLNE